MNKKLSANGYNDVFQEHPYFDLPSFNAPAMKIKKGKSGKKSKKNNTGNTGNTSNAGETDLITKSYKMPKEIIKRIDLVAYWRRMKKQDVIAEALRSFLATMPEEYLREKETK